MVLASHVGKRRLKAEDVVASIVMASIVTRLANRCKMLHNVQTASFYVAFRALCADFWWLDDWPLLHVTHPFDANGALQVAMHAQSEKYKALINVSQFVDAEVSCVSVFLLGKSLQLSYAKELCLRTDPLLASFAFRNETSKATSNAYIE